MEVHVSERRYKCGECGKLYKTVGHVREHMRAHSDERPYHCARCNKGYKTKVIIDLGVSSLIQSLEIQKPFSFLPRMPCRCISELTVMRNPMCVSSV